jgi:hypothetical protein
MDFVYEYKGKPKKLHADSLAYLYKSNQEFINMLQSEFIERCEWLIKNGHFNSRIRLGAVLKYVNFDVDGLIGLAEACKKSGAKITLGDINIECFGFFVSDDYFRFDVLKKVIDFINQNYKHKRITGELKPYNLICDGRMSVAALRSWVIREDQNYSAMLYTYGTYLGRSARAYDRDREFEQEYERMNGRPYQYVVPRNVTPKIMVREKGWYKNADGQMKDVVACLNGIERGEIYCGKRLYSEVKSLKQGCLPRLAKFFEAEYGVTVEMLNKGERQGQMPTESFD